MTSYERLEHIRTQLKAELPAVFAAHGLEDFSDYLIGEPYTVNDSVVGIYTLEWEKSPERETWTCMLIFQCYQRDDVYQYESILLPALPSLLPARNLGMTLFGSIDSAVSPPQESSSTFIFISISYQRDLDDMEDF